MRDACISLFSFENLCSCSALYWISEEFFLVHTVSFMDSDFGSQVIIFWSDLYFLSQLGQWQKLAKLKIKLQYANVTCLNKWNALYFYENQGKHLNIKKSVTFYLNSPYALKEIFRLFFLFRDNFTSGVFRYDLSFFLLFPKSSTSLIIKTTTTTTSTTTTQTTKILIFLYQSVFFDQSNKNVNLKKAKIK